ncbi:MAG: thiamine pyrophosphate-dependent enzyme [Pseudomonadota bacterium]
MSEAGRLDRRAAVGTLLKPRMDTIVVSGLGSPTYDVAAFGDDPLNFYLWGAMGGAAMVGLGLAIAQPSSPVVVFTGDGEMLMGMGSFAAIAGQAPANLSIVIIDNELYGETGAQETHTARGADLAAIARASGIPNTETVTDTDGVENLSGRLHLYSGGPRVAVLKVGAAPSGKTLVVRDGAYNKGRLREALNLPPD